MRLPLFPSPLCQIRKATPMLLQALTRDQLIFPLFVLIAQQRNAILFKSSSSSSSSSSQVQQLSLLAEAYDRCQDALTQVPCAGQK